MRPQLAIFLLPLMLMGCAKNNAAPLVAEFDPDRDQIGDQAPWPFWPTQMRVHPLTRIVVEQGEGDGGGRILEARIEFTDRDAYTTRAYGFLRLELYADDPAIAAEQLIGWNVDLRDLDRNDTYFDDVSRTYLFRLDLEDALVADEPVLVVEYYSLNGLDLHDARRVRR